MGKKVRSRRRNGGGTEERNLIHIEEDYGGKGGLKMEKKGLCNLLTALKGREANGYMVMVGAISNSHVLWMEGVL